MAVPRTKLEKRIVSRLADYIGKVLHKQPKIVVRLEEVPNGSPAVFLANAAIESPVPVRVPGTADEGFALQTSNIDGRHVVIAAGKTDKGLKRAVQRLIMESRQEDRALVIPGVNLSETPWIPHREWTACPWVPEFVRGAFRNPYADSRFNLFKYDKKRLSNYVEMMDWLGFSGSQLMETCYAYNMFGSPEAAQEWQKSVAQLLRENGQEVSLWAWSANFTGFGWSDPDVSYSPKAGLTAYDDPQVHKSFEKYYDHYANLAPYVDRFIAHFFDPGQLTDMKDVMKYMRLQETKLKAKNPKIQMGIDCWASSSDYLKALVDAGFKDYLILPVAFPIAYGPGQREAIHAQASKLGLNLGIWGWYITEYETDQLPSMYVNAQMMKRFYGQMKNGVMKTKPVDYWSEMEAHHLNNIYTMYASAQLLWNPDRDPHQILSEISEGIWGPKNGPKVLKALELIQDVRTGPKWETYWWTSKEYRLGTADPARDLKRAEESLQELQSMGTDETYVPKIPLPYPPATFVELMLPHLRQIKQFAEFRIKVAQIEKAAQNGASKETLQTMLRDAWQPIPEYNTWVGTFGTPELRQQRQIVSKLKAQYKLDVKDPEPLRCLEESRVLDRARILQALFKQAMPFTAKDICSEFFWPEEVCQDRVDKLVTDGLAEKLEGNMYRLVDWENWAAH